MTALERSQKFITELQKQRVFAHIEHELAKKNLKRKGAFHWRWYVGSTGFVFCYVLLFMSSLIMPTFAKIISAKIFRYHAKFYFYCLGLISDNQKFNHQALEPGTLLLTTRENAWKALFLFSQRKQLMIVPTEFGFFEKFTKKQIMWRMMARCFKTVSYPDQIFEKQASRLQQLLDKGYVVLSYLNEGQSSRLYQKKLYLDQKVLSFIDKQLARKKNVFCINIKNWHGRSLASFKTPFPIESEYLSVDMLYKVRAFNTKKSSPEYQKASALAHFFGFPNHELLL